MSEFPTEFVKKIASTVELHGGADLVYTPRKERDTEDFKKAESLYVALQDFQKLAAYNDFENSLIAYTGIELTQDQMTALRVIHKSTGPWMKGHVADKLLTKMNSDDSKVVVNIAAMLLDSLNEGGDLDLSSASKLIINLAK